MSDIIDSTHPKGVHAASIFAAAYNQHGLTEDAAQRINLRGNELKDAISEALRRLAAEGRILSIGRQVDMLIARGYHTACKMTEAEYRKVWGTDVEQFPEYVGRLDLPFLVDDTLTLEQKVACNANMYLGVKPEQCTTNVPHPVHPETGARLTRYVAFIQLNRYLNHRVEDVDALLPADEVGLTPTEGVHLPGQCEKHLRKYGVDLSASRCGSSVAPYVHWFGGVQPYMGAHSVGLRVPFYGSGSRGIRVVPVSWAT